MLYEGLPEGRVKCNLCGRRCLVPSGGLGFCRVRRNDGGILYSLVYAKACSIAVDPIEKKPLFHFHPGSAVYSVATVGCNFRCRGCDNWLISQAKDVEGEEFPPEDVVKEARRHGCHGVSYTYSEPTIFYEWAYDTAKLSHKEGLFNTFVTNGYMTPEAVETIAPYLDAATVDFKGSGNPKFYRDYATVLSVEPIYECLLEMKRRKVFIEITNLIVPEIGDSAEDLRRLAAWIKDNLGPETPFHLLRFFPEYMMTDSYSTPRETLEKLYKLAKEEGLHYVYLGNMPGHKAESTYCHACNELLISRFSFDIVSWNLDRESRCPRCGEKVNIVGRYVKGGRRWLPFL